ncbi:porin family protein [Aquimarina algicola]|uniref:PorT family protein n=1 Tax=Aquimarina algicola TaxID=2589995 RepID=A0A504J0V7_9FLAO|nr:porin family protein [Aquimarina algicola]TPN84466.1 PorT family protein [Aquimarina algicola]
MRNFILLALAFCSTFIYAQESLEKTTRFGVRGGLNFSTITGDDFEDPKSRTSFYAGLVAETFISEKFALQGEVFYSGQGFDIEETSIAGVTVTPDAEFQIDYIQVPLLAKIYIVEGLNIHAGPQFGFKINEEFDTDPTADGGDFDTDRIKDFDFQLAAGAEFKLLSNFFIQARYTYGLSEVIEDTDAHNSTFSAGIGFMF